MNNYIYPQALVINHSAISPPVMTNLYGVHPMNNINNIRFNERPEMMYQQNENPPPSFEMGPSKAPQVQTLPLPYRFENNEENTRNIQSGNSKPVSTETVTTPGLDKLVKEVNPNLELEGEVENMLLEYLDHFVDDVVQGACLLAKYNHRSSIAVKDVQHILNRKHSLWIPGYGIDDVHVFKRNMQTESHKQRMALIKKASRKV